MKSRNVITLIGTTYINHPIGALAILTKKRHINDSWQEIFVCRLNMLSEVLVGGENVFTLEALDGRR